MTAEHDTQDSLTEAQGAISSATVSVQKSLQLTVERANNVAGLLTKSESLNSTAEQFLAHGQQLERDAWRKEWATRIIAIIATLFVLCVVFYLSRTAFVVVFLCLCLVAIAAAVMISRRSDVRSILMGEPVEI
eukprot:Trichotokara_eunicae@DN6073_c0_g1_i1.p1